MTKTYAYERGSINKNTALLTPKLPKVNADCKSIYGSYEMDQNLPSACRYRYNAVILGDFELYAIFVYSNDTLFDLEILSLFPVNMPVPRL